MPYSFSQLSVYRTCPRQYEFANIKKIPRSISAGESFGSSVHNTLSKWGKLEMQSSKLGDVQDQLKLFIEEVSHRAPDLTLETLLDLWHQSFIVQGYASKVDADAARRKGEVLMRHFYEWWSKTQRTVLAVETGFSVEDANIKGRFDRVEQRDDGAHVIDFKTGGIRTQEEVDADLQLSMYAMAAAQEFSMPCTQLTLLFLHEDGITEMHTTRSEEQLKQAQEGIGLIADSIEDDAFDPTPSDHACGRCPYRTICDAAVKV